MTFRFGLVAMLLTMLVSTCAGVGAVGYFVGIRNTQQIVRLTTQVRALESAHR